MILDGATGTELQRRGVAMDPSAWSGVASLANQRVLTEIHRDYIAAGAEVITANTFASSRAVLSQSGHGDKVEAINRAAVEAGPYLEAFKARGLEVLFLFDPIDDYVVTYLRELSRHGAFDPANWYGAALWPIRHAQQSFRQRRTGSGNRAGAATV